AQPEPDLHPYRGSARPVCRSKALAAPVPDPQEPRLSGLEYFLQGVAPVVRQFFEPHAKGACRGLQPLQAALRTGVLPTAPQSLRGGSSGVTLGGGEETSRHPGKMLPTPGTDGPEPGARAVNPCRRLDRDPGCGTRGQARHRGTKLGQDPGRSPRVVL